MPEGMKEKEMIDLLLKRFIKDYDKTKNPEVRTRYGVFAGIVGIICNLILFLAKIIAGVHQFQLWRMQSITYRMQDLQLLHL